MSASADLELTLAAMDLHDWNIVLLEGRLKRPPLGAPWHVTGDSDIAEAHAIKGGNLGLVCGALPGSGVAVLDFDDPDAALAMAQKLGALPVAVVTGSGKAHVYIAHEPGLPAKLRWQGAIVGELQRGPMQQVVLPGSVHPDTGALYRWAVNPLEWAPPTLPVAWRRHLSSDDRPRNPSETVSEGFDGALPSASELLSRALSLPGGKRRTTGVKFQCPACRAEGHDKHQDNARVDLEGKWGCAYAPGDRGHRRAIGEALGVVRVR
jgi:hypothetical protein